MGQPVKELLSYEKKKKRKSKRNMLRGFLRGVEVQHFMGRYISYTYSLYSFRYLSDQY